MFEWTTNNLRKEVLIPNQKAGEKRGRPELRWEYGVDKDVKAVKERNRKNIPMSR
jgi:hypothetical protein